MQDFKQLLNFLTIYHATMAIPMFKRDKIREYMKLMSNFCVKEISNSHQIATLYHTLLEEDK